MSPLETVIQKARKLRPNAKINYLAAVREFLAYAGEPASWDNPSSWLDGAREAVEKWRDALEGKKLQPQTINVKLAGLRYATKRWSEMRGNRAELDFATFAERLPISGRPGQKRKPLTAEQARSLIAACDGEQLDDIRDKALISLALRTGLRRFSLVALDIGDVRRTGTSVVIKGGRAHPLPLLDEKTWIAILTWLKVLQGNGITAGSVFRQVRNGRILAGLTIWGVHDIMKRRAKQAGIPRFSAHICRHTFVSSLREMGVADHLIAAYTGHVVKGDILGVYTDSSGIAGRDGVTDRLPY